VSEKKLQQQIDELESKLVFFEDGHQQLNDIVVRQDDVISRLQMQVQELAKRLGDVAYSVEQGGAAGQDKPPHY
jgi:SlyX protein